MTQKILVGVVVALAVLWAIFQLTNDPKKPAAPPSTPAPVTGAPPATGTKALMIARTASQAQLRPFGTDKARMMTDSLRAPLASPEAAMKTAVERLIAKNDTGFRQTFMPKVWPELTAEVIEKCRSKVGAGPVSPDWGAAEDATEAGHPVKRVSIFGKSMTGFHNLADQWFADRVWCLPTGTP